MARENWKHAPDRASRCGSTCGVVIDIAESTSTNCLLYLGAHTSSENCALGASQVPSQDSFLYVRLLSLIPLAEPIPPSID